MKKVRVFSNVVREKEERNEDKRKESGRHNFFVFCEKNTGVAHFRAGSLTDSEYSLDRLAGQFAMQCLVRGYDPNDFVVLVPAEDAVVGKLVSRAKDLLEEGRAVSGPETLSPRQKEILHSVLCNRANKEIASKLNITVRTVKFHISSLLNKFGVDNRIDLARRAAGLLRPAPLDPAGTGPTSNGGGTREGSSGAANTNFHIEHKPRSVRFPGRMATA